jgi:hypothetical protein
VPSVSKHMIITRICILGNGGFLHQSFYSQAHHNAALVRWIKTQRKNYKSSSLSEDRISLLNEIGMPWEPQTDNWDAMYQKLLEYKEEVSCLLA